MTQILITSTVLIVVILLLRQILRKRVSKRLIYATWLLVALRLLIPIQFGQSEYSVVTVTERLTQDSEPVQQVQQSFREPVAGPSREELYQQLMQDYLAQTKEPVTTPQPEASIPTSQPSVSPELHAQIQQEVEQQIAAPTLGQIFNIVWISGMVLMAGWFLITNLLFLRRARKDAIACTDVTAPVRIRISPSVSTPCLAGLFRPVIYLTPLSVEDSQTRNHVLTHELTHLRHLDHIWAWIRCICLCVYWFHPLVWVAAIVSKRDCELACDEAALKKLGDGQRIAYGKTLLATVTHSPARVLQTATAMSETKKQLKERVNFIVKKPKNLLIAAVCLILAVTLTAGLVFTGCKSEPEPTTPSTSQDPTTNPDSVESTPDMPTEDDMLELLNQAAQMVENNAIVTLDTHWLATSYLDFNKLPPEVLTINDDTITINTTLTQFGTSRTDDKVYATFLALLAKQYPDDFTPMDIHYEPTFGRGPFYYAFFYTGWREAGYNSIKDYYAAIDAGEVEMPQNAFKIGYQYPYINLVSSQNVTDDIYAVFISQRDQTPDNTPVASTGESLLQLLQDAADIVDTTETIKLDPYFYVESYLNAQSSILTHSQALTITDDYILIHTNLSPGNADWTEVYTYAVFLDLLLDQYEDDTTKWLYSPITSSGVHPSKFFLYTGWQEAGYDSIHDYYTAIHDGTIDCPSDAFFIGYQYRCIYPVISSSGDLCEGFFSNVSTSPVEPSDTFGIAEKAVDDYLWYWVVGVCCDYEYVHADMSQYLTDSQKESYFNVQYKLNCCHTAAEVHNHIDRCIGAELRTCGYPDDRLFTDDVGNLYLIVIPTDYNGYRHIELLSESDDAISVRACQYDEDGCYLSLIFSLSATNSGYQITAVTQDDDYECTPQIVNQGPSYMVLKYGAFSYGYQLYDTDGSLKVNEDTGFRCPTVTPLSTHVTEIRLNYGTGIARRFYWDAQTLTCSDSYDYVVAASPQKIAYLDGDLDNRTLVVCDIFDRSTAQTFTDLGIYAAVMPVIAATFSEDGTELEITYYTAKNIKKTVTLNLTI